jgi:hypothetical protein
VRLMSWRDGKVDWKIILLVISTISYSLCVRTMVTYRRGVRSLVGEREGRRINRIGNGRGTEIDLFAFSACGLSS